MADKPYQKREIDSFMKNLTDKLEEHHNDVMTELTEIKVQTTQHNGRMRSLEMSRAQIWGAIGVLVLLGGGIITLSVRAIDQKIEEGIRKGLADAIEIYGE